MMAAILTYGLMMVSCADSIDDNPTNPSDESESENIIEPSVFADLMDINTYAGDNFYGYAVGRWLDEHPLKDDEYNNGTMAAGEGKYSVFEDAVGQGLWREDRHRRGDHRPASGLLGHGVR